MQNFIKNAKFNRIILIFLLFFIYIFISAFSYANEVCVDIANNIFRLHVIANSDTDVDQNLKYIVRDNVLEFVNTLSNEVDSKEDIIKIVTKDLSKIQEIAQQTVFDNGFNYNVNVEVGNFAFPTKKYGDITLPPGYYDALRIEIGEAKGQNWWCVMFPPLCFVDITSGIVPDESKEFIKENLSEEEYSLISENSNNIKIKFKLVEVLQNLSISGIFM